MTASADGPPSFEEYVAARSGALLRYAYVLTSDKHAAEDLLQTALLKAHRHWRTVAAADSPDAYVRRVMTNTHISAARRRRIPETLTAVLPDRPASRADVSDEVTDRDEVRRALSRLPPKQRAVLVLRHYAGYDDDAIGRTLGCSPGAVRTNASRGAARLREVLGDLAATAPAPSRTLEPAALVERDRRRRARQAVVGSVVAVLTVIVAAVALPQRSDTSLPVRPAVSVPSRPTPSGRPVVPAPTPLPGRLLLAPGELSTVNATGAWAQQMASADAWRQCSSAPELASTGNGNRYLQTFSVRPPDELAAQWVREYASEKAASVAYDLALTSARDCATDEDPVLDSNGAVSGVGDAAHHLVHRIRTLQGNAGWQRTSLVRVGARVSGVTIESDGTPAPTSADDRAMLQSMAERLTE